jgi:Tfp pilus assembly protein PilX
MEVPVSRRHHGRNLNRACSPRAAHARRRGGIYIAVLVAVLIVTLIGLAGLQSARIDRRAAAANEDAIRARFAARSYAEVIFQRLQADSSWRSSYTNNTWSASEPLDSGQVKFKLVDDADGDLADDSTEPFRIQTQAAYGSATRGMSISVQPANAGSGGSAPERLSNASMEAFTVATSPPTGWYQWPSGPGEASTTSSHGGARNARIYSRTAVTSSLSQDLPVTALRKGATYDIKGWAKFATIAGTLRVGLVVTDSTGATTKFTYPIVTVTSIWNDISGSVTPTWSGTLTAARFTIESAAGTGEIRGDDLSLTERSSGGNTNSVISGSMRRDLAE